MSNEENISNTGNKVITLFVQKITDKTALENRIDELQDKGTAVYVMVLGVGYDGSSKSIINCETELKLRLNISELYGVFNNISQVMSANNESIIENSYSSDFRSEKHAFINADKDKNSFGAAIAAVLNLYGCLPIYTDEYNLLSNNTYIDDVNNIALGETSVVSDSAANDISGFCQQQYQKLH